MMVPQATRPNPYLGPRAFQTGETLYGRERDAHDLLGLLIAERIVLVHSPSGAGKTSLLQAALIPLLRARQFTVLPVIRVSAEPPSGITADARGADDGFKPIPGAEVTTRAPARQPTTTTPNRYLLSVLSALEEGLPAAQQRPLAELATLSLNDYLDQRPGVHEDDDEVLIFDQFEEILTVDPTDQAAKVAFFVQVGAALRNRRRWALFAMREDYVAALAPYLRPLPTRLSTTFRLDLLSLNDARQAMIEPARQQGITFAEDAALQLVNDLCQVYVQRPDGSTVQQAGSTVEPVQLQVVCYRLWERVPPDVATIGADAVAAAGDVGSALSDYYAERVATIAAHTGVAERAIRDWCDRQLISLQGIRSQVLQTPEQSQGLANHAIAGLIDAYLVRAEPRRRATWLELAHDRLIAPVRASNAAWNEAHLSTLQHQADLWERQGRPAGLLLHDAALIDAERWASTHADAVTAVDRAFLALCVEAHDREVRARRQARLIRNLAIVALAVSLVAVLAFVVAMEYYQDARTQEANANASAGTARTAEAFANTQRHEADAQRLRAEQQEQIAQQQARQSRARALAAAAESNLNVDPLRSVLLATAAVSATRAYTEPVVPEAQQALQQALQASRVRQIFQGHTKGIRSAAYSPDGRRIATAGNDGTTRIWDAARITPLKTFVATSDQVLGIAWNPNGEQVVTANSDGVAQVWNLATSTAVLTLTHTAPLNAVAYCPDGTQIATTTVSGTLTVWDARTGQSLQTMDHDGGLEGVAWDPADPTQVATAGDDGSLTVWNATTGRVTHTITDTGSLVYGIAWNPDGTQIAAANENLVVTVWDVASGAAVHTLKGHASTVYDVAWSPDGHTLASASADGTAKLWSLADEREIVTLYGHSDTVTTVRFSPDGGALLTGSIDLTARVWSVGLIPPTGANAVDYAPSGTQLVTASSAGAYLWDARTGRAQGVISATADLNGAVFNPDGTRVAIADTNGIATVWTLQRNQAPVELTGHTAAIARIAWSPDGTRIATASDDTTVRVWEAHNGAAQLTLAGHTDWVYGVAWSPDGTRLASAGQDGRAFLWDTRSGAQLQVLTDTRKTAFNAITFSPDGRLLALADERGTTTLLDARTGTPVRTLHVDQAMLDVAWSPDSTRIATANRDKQVRVWDVATGTLRFALPHPAEVNSLAWSPDGTQIATVAADEVARVFTIDLDALLRLARARTVRVPTAEECHQYGLGCP